MTWLILFWVCAGAFLYSHVLYPLVLVLFTRRPAVPPANPSEWPSVSVLLSVYNEEKHIADRIENLRALDYPADKLEFLIGSDGSTDRTDDLLAQCRDPRVRVHIAPDRGGKPRILNQLAAQARGDLLAFTDANTMFAPDALKKLARHFCDARIGGVCGRLVFHGPQAQTDEGPYWKLETFLKTRESRLDSCLGANGAIYAIRHALWPAIPNNTFVDDFVIGIKVREQGARVLYDPDAVATEDLPVSVGHEMTRRIRIGAGGFQALSLCWRSLLPWRGAYTLAFWSHKALRWFGPFFMLGALVANSQLLSHPFYCVTMTLQILLYSLALVGVLVRRKITLFSAPRYFVGMNIALLFGFVRYVTGTQRAAWKRTAR